MIQPRWLKLKEAARYSAIGKQRLIRLAEAGQIRGFRDPDSGRGDWIFDRGSIDAYREAQCSGQGIRNKALELLGKIVYKEVQEPR